MHKGYAIAKALKIARENNEPTLAIHCGCGTYAVKLRSIYPSLPLDTVAIAFPDGTVRELDRPAVLFPDGTVRELDRPAVLFPDGTVRELDRPAVIMP